MSISKIRGLFHAQIENSDLTITLTMRNLPMNFLHNFSENHTEVCNKMQYALLEAISNGELVIHGTDHRKTILSEEPIDIAAVEAELDREETKKMN